MQDPRDELLTTCLRALAGEVEGVTWNLGPGQPGTGADRLLHLVLPEHALTFAVEARDRLTEATLQMALHRLEHAGPREHPPLVCARRIAPDQGRRLRERGVAHMDAGGNAFLRGPGLWIDLRGRKPPTRQRPPKGLTRSEARLLGVFLTRAEAGTWTQQELADAADIALGGVGKARERLVQLGLLEHLGTREFRILDRPRALAEFADNWETRIRPNLDPQTCRRLDGTGRGDLAEDLDRPEARHVLLGGEGAAARTTGTLRTRHATLHVPRAERARVAKALTLIPDEEGTITLLDRYGTGDEDPDHEGLAHPLLVWAECCTIPDERLLPATRALRERLLERADA